MKPSLRSSICFRWAAFGPVPALLPVLALLLSGPAAAQSSGEPEAAGSKRAAYFRLLTLYGRDDAPSLAEGERLLDSVLSRSAADKVNAEDRFAHSAAVMFYRAYGNKLPAALQERARLDISNRVKAIERSYYPTRRSNFKMGHLNFALLYLEAFILGSEIIGDSATAGKAYNAFDECCEYTLHNGFTEFNAPNYYKVDLHCLGSLAGASTNAHVRRRAAAFAEFLWLETALHYWPSQEWLTGANSRNYNYVGGWGGALNLVRPFFGERAFDRADWRAVRKRGGEAGWVASFDYEPPTYLREVAREKQACVYQGLWLAPEPDEFRRGFEGESFERWGHGEFGHEYGKDRYTFFEPAYSLGTSGAAYSGQDRALVADIASAKPLASISSQLNTRVPLSRRGEFLQFLARSHLHTGTAAVQDRNLALLLYSVTLPQGSGEAFATVAPLLLLPANVDRVLIGNQPADRRAGPHSLRATDALYLQEGEVYASLRFVKVTEGFAGYKPTYHYRLDGRYELKTRSEGARTRREFPVGALSCVLYDGKRQLLSGEHVRAGFVVEMATRKEYPTLAEFQKHIESDTAIIQNWDKGIWQVRYRSGDREISIKKNLANGLILDKQVNGVRVEAPVHKTTFSELADGVLTVQWKGQTHRIDLRRNEQP